MTNAKQQNLDKPALLKIPPLLLVWYKEIAFFSLRPYINNIENAGQHKTKPTLQHTEASTAQFTHPMCEQKNVKQSLSNTERLSTIRQHCIVNTKFKMQN